MSFAATPTLSADASNALEIVEGDSVVLTCSVGEVVGAYEWRLDNEVVAGQTGSKLVFASYSSSDDGSYTCYADNSLVSNAEELKAKQGMV